ncbi:MAG: hypothetical protein ACOC0M_09760 [Halomonas sp.]
MSLLPTAHGPRRRGATRRRRGHRPFGVSDLDRWLDRVVDLAVIVALVVGGAALILTLLL